MIYGLSGNPAVLDLSFDRLVRPVAFRPGLSEGLALSEKYYILFTLILHKFRYNFPTYSHKKG